MVDEHGAKVRVIGEGKDGGQAQMGVDEHGGVVSVFGKVAKARVRLWV